MSNFGWMIATNLGFFAAPLAVCLMRAFGPRWFNAWVALGASVALGAPLYFAASFFAYEQKMDDLRARGIPVPGAFENVEPPYAFYSVLINIVSAAIYYAPFALAYYLWQEWKRDRAKLAIGDQIEDNR